MIKRVVGSVRIPCDGLRCNAVAAVELSESDGPYTWLCFACAREEFKSQLAVIEAMEKEPPI